jgi:hypothetical protein
MNRRARLPGLVVFACLMAAACSKTPPPPGPPPQGPSAYRQAVLSDKPVAYWRLDESAGTKAFDQSSATNHGTFEGAVRLQEPGATSGDGDKAILLDTQARVVIPNSPSLQIRSGALTLEAWVKRQTNQLGQTVILCKGTAGVQTEYCLVLMDGVPAYQSVVEQYVASGDALPTNVWTHIAVAIADNAKGTFYINGAEAGTFSSTTRHIVTSSTQPIVIGNEAGVKARSFAGAIDEPAIYDYTLTGEQIAKHFAAATQKVAGETAPPQKGEGQP